MKYVVLNCPAFGINLTKHCRDKQMKCQDCTDCLIKQVIEKVANLPLFLGEYSYKAEENLDMFEIVEV